MVRLSTSNRLGTALAAMLIAATVTAVPVAAQFARDPAEAAATERDYQATLKRLGIGSLRPGANGRDPTAPDAANFDEARAQATALPLPDALRTEAGGRVTSEDMWRRVRRPELVRLFDREVYGRVPDTAPAVRWEVTGRVEEQRNGVPVVTRTLVGHAGEGTARPVRMELGVTVPARVRGRVPVILSLTFPASFRFPGRQPPAPGTDWTDQVLARGWGYATLAANSVQADNGAGLSGGVIGLSLGGRPRAADEWGALRAWAWGMSRAIDWLERDPAVDARRIGVEGLSRYGKAALVAMAYDQRIAIGLIGSSGAGGAKPLRRNFGEKLENLTASGEYHWFAPNFLRYAGPRTVADLPVDAHDLIAMAAPRAVFIGAGNYAEDGWVDPRGSFEAAAAASPVWSLLGARGLSSREFPPVLVGATGGTLAYRQHQGGHSNVPSWPAFLDFAQREFARIRP